MRLTPLPLFVLALLTANVSAAPQVRYRITPISPDGYVQVTGWNNRGEVIGYRNLDDGTQQGFIWRNGRFTYLNARFDPPVPVMEPQGLNDRSQITGYYSDGVTQRFFGFLLDRGTERIIDGPPGAQTVFVNLINDRELILGSSYDEAGNESWWLLDEGTYTVLDPSFLPGGLNVRGVIAGRQYVPATGTHAAYWEDGAITLIGPPFSSATGINDRGQITGTIDNNGASRAFVWERGVLTPLPKLRADQTYSWPGRPNNAGVIGGTTVINEPTGTVNIATLWDNGRAFDLNNLIHPEDPLRAFVTFHTAGINDRGEILAQGTNSQTPGLAYYLLRPARR